MNENNHVNQDLLHSFFTKNKKLRRAVKIEFNYNKYMELVGAIEKDVNRIRSLIEGTRSREPIRATKAATEAAEFFFDSRSGARSLFKALSSCWPQSCRCGSGITRHLSGVCMYVLFFFTKSTKPMSTPIPDTAGASLIGVLHKKASYRDRVTAQQQDQSYDKPKVVSSHRFRAFSRLQ